MHRPDTPQALAEALRALADARQPIRLGGNFSKDRLGGPCVAGEVVSTSSDEIACWPTIRATSPLASKLVCRSPNCKRILAEQRQMLPLDPPWLAQSTVGGVVRGESQRPASAPVRPPRAT
jgi:hypothetical protein